MFFNDLQTERLLLRNIAAGDRDFIFSQFSDKEVNRYLFDTEPLTDLKGADEIIAFYLRPEPRRQHRWILVRKADGVKMGTCGFHVWNRAEAKVEVGYDLKAEFWRQGYMREALETAFTFAENEMQVKEIDACIAVDNQRSIRLAESFGFVLSGATSLSFRGQNYPHHVYTLHLPRGSVTAFQG
jgi:[ribosomal protein S5]-alanine N-acetyltransferase